jgi:hypothetical protein
MAGAAKTDTGSDRRGKIRRVTTRPRRRCSSNGVAIVSLLWRMRLGRGLRSCTSPEQKRCNETRSVHRYFLFTKSRITISKESSRLESLIAHSFQAPRKQCHHRQRTFHSESPQSMGEPSRFWPHKGLLLMLTPGRNLTKW